VCLADGIVADADLIDVAMVFGTPYAPFRDGPVAYSRDRGVAEIMDWLNALEREYGERFRPHPGWLQFDNSTQVP
jgi:3-hydroxyacyl-CoA dehydrogenase/enoyl-CoA hydratase/3-hydroxybutyryl-CoA epimerase